MAGPRSIRFLALVAAVLGSLFLASQSSTPPDAGSSSPVPEPRVASKPHLPPEAIETLALVKRGGPFPYRKDGSVFHNRERLLPIRPPAYYREYTVPTPGADNRGARRLVVGGKPPEVFYYTSDHYRSFTLIEGKP